ncbi:MAG: putative quinol monooxygenase [Gammaproteobacteria bacterium]
MAGPGYACYMRVRVLPEKREEFVGLVLQLRADVARELRSVLFYEFLATANPLEFVFMLGFVDEAAYQEYADAPFHVAMAPLGWACLDGEPHIEFLRPATI